MADNKKSFIMYSDWIHTINKLNDEQAGKLIKHLLAYVNDKNPELNDLLLEIAFEPIKQQLKRDLKHWDNIREKRAESGRSGGLAKASKASKSKQSLANLAVTVNDNVNVNDTVNDITISKDIEQAPEKVEYGNQEINNLLKDFEEIMGFKSSSSKDRIFGNHLIKNYTGEQLKTMLTYCATNTYAPRIGSLEKMWFKRGDIIAGIKSQSNKITIIN